MKRKGLIAGLVLVMTVAASGQTNKLNSKINLLGIGYGIEYYFNPKFSWHNELGYSFWEKLSDKIQDEAYFVGISKLNPYIISSLRYYFIPLHSAKNENIEIGWRISTSYTGMYSIENFMQFTGKNKQQLGIFAGTSMRFSKLLFFELELGPAYQWNDFTSNKFNFLGNMGAGFYF